MLRRRYQWSYEKVQETVVLQSLHEFSLRNSLSASHQELFYHRNSLRSFLKYDEFRNYRFPIDPERVTKLYST